MSEERAMSESKKWRECADPVELAASVAAGVEVQRNWGYDWQPGTNNETAEQFAGCTKANCRYRVPASWSWSPEPPADVPTGAERYLAERLADPEYRAAYEAAAPVTGDDSSTGRQFRVGFEVSESGIRVVEVAMTAGPSESITARKIQAARLGEIIRLSLMTVAMPLDPDTSQWRPGMAGDWPTEQMERSWSSEGRGRGRPQSVTVDEYEQAANEYRAAQAEGRPTTRAVADALGVSESTARKRIMAARGRGLLPPADTTRPRL